MAASSDAISAGAWHSAAGPLNLARHEAAALGRSTDDLDCLVEGLDDAIGVIERHARSFLDAIGGFERYADGAVHLNDNIQIAAQ